MTLVRACASEGPESSLSLKSAGLADVYGFCMVDSSSGSGRKGFDLA